MLELTRESAWEIATGGPWPESLSGGERDEYYMLEAIRESMAGIGLSSPNPSVGCVLTKDGRIIGRGAHKRAGGPHAEVSAIDDAERRRESPTGATAYVTLEPCCHFGLTPPCTDALLRAGVKRVVVGVRDVNPRVAGGGLAILRANGVEVVEGVLRKACLRLHTPFFKSVRTGLPWVTLKLALGADNGIGPVGARTNITAPEVQRFAHALRRVNDGILVGRNTVEIDNPQLTDRWFEPSEPHRVLRRIVLDSRGSLSRECRVWQGESGHSAMRVLTEEALPIDGVEDLRLPPGPGGCSLRHLLHEITLRGVSRLLIEGGPTLASRMLQDDLIDVLHIFRGAKPAGGLAVILDAVKLDSPSKFIRFNGGVWEVWDRAYMA
ncbi:MAG: bifunctional diaminohydroxyphosphoribosylaminopyrimidine deaminase/5-amino-6-(5-phosphoribosylamino)uracil reductase RibD [Holophagales bacterium]|nr:bifunctional diaminohydroxyphosphoribosylaminopyrimidine deaminase/5-amino-6-(5-phosphoribosylamino)uracil reductase RibD [Holophagales bacterium]